MRTARASASPLLAAALATNAIINAIAETIYLATLRRALRTIARYR